MPLDIRRWISSIRHADTHARSAAILFGVNAISLLPLLVLYIEFHNIGAFCEDSFWFYVAKMYGSYFLFPTFGILAAAFLVVPFATFWLILKREEFRPFLRRVLYAWIALVATASALEFTGSPYAVFEVSPQVLTSHAGRAFFDDFKTICSGASKFKGPGGSEKYQGELANARSMGRSYSGLVYYAAIPAQAGLLVTLLCGFFLMAYFKKPYVTEFLSREGLNWEKDNVFVLFGFALTVGSVWCLYRISYRMDEKTLFGASSNALYADYLVLGLYLLVIAFYIVFVGLDLEKVAKTASQIVGAVAVVGFSLSAPAGLTGYFFGLDASIQNLVGLIAALLVLIAIGLLFNAPPPVLPPLEEEDG